MLTKEGKLLAFGNNEYNKLCLNMPQIGFKNAVDKQMTSKLAANAAIDVTQQHEPVLVAQLSAHNVFKVCPGATHTAIIDCKRVPYFSI